MELDEFIEGAKESLEKSLREQISGLLSFDDIKAELSEDFDDFSIGGVLSGLKGLGGKLSEKVEGIGNKIGSLAGLGLVSIPEVSLDNILSDESSEKMFSFVDDLNELVLGGE